MYLKQKYEQSRNQIQRNETSSLIEYTEISAELPNKDFLDEQHTSEHGLNYVSDDLRSQR